MSKKRRDADDFKREQAAKKKSAERYEFHPIASMFPLMEGDEFDALVADIKAHGQNQPIIIYEDMILDGRNRYRACIEAGVEPSACLSYVDSHAEAVAYVISANIRRRHLDADTKRKIIESLIKATPEKSDRTLAKEAKADRETISRARKRLTATGGMPPVEKRVGADGKTRKTPATETAAEIEEEQVSNVERNADFTPEQVSAAENAVLDHRFPAPELTPAEQAQAHKTANAMLANVDAEFAADEQLKAEIENWNGTFLDNARAMLRYVKGCKELLEREDHGDIELKIKQEMVDAARALRDAWGEVASSLHTAVIMQKAPIEQLEALDEATTKH